MILPAKERKEIPLTKVMVSPWETRKSPQVDDGFVDSLKGGLIDPITVWYDAERDVYRLVSGQRRTIGGRKLGWEFIDALVFVEPLVEIQAIAANLISNVQHAPLDDVDAAEGVDKLARLMGSTNVDVAKAIGKSPPTVTRLRRRAGAPDWLKAMMRNGLAGSTADALLECDNEDLMRGLAEQIGPKHWSRDDVKRVLRGDKPKRAKQPSVVVARPGKPSIVVRGLANDTPMQQATEVVRELLTDLVKAAKTHAKVGDAIKAWRLAGA